jgi:hypothetical protein
MNWQHQFLVCADDFNLVGKSINTINRNTGALLKASSEVGLEVNTEKTEYMLMSHHQTGLQKYNLMIPENTSKTWHT